MTKEELALKDNLRTKVREKFGTITNFLRISGIDKGDFQKAFMDFYAEKPEFKKLIVEADKLCDELDNQNPVDDQLSDEKRQLLKEAIDKEGGVIKFCKDNTKFSQVSVFQILSGRRKRISPIIKNLLEHFKIE